MVPAPRLLWLAALAGIPLLTVLSIVPRLAWLGLPILGMLIAWVGWDAWRGRSKAFLVKVTAPERVNLMVNRTDPIELRLENPTETARQVRLGLDLPTQAGSEVEDLTVQLPGGSANSAVEWRCRPTFRGRLQIRSAHVEMESRSRFWNIRAAYPLETELRVYPDLFGDRKRIAAVLLHRNSAGIRAQRQVGKGRDFEKLREYSPGDSFDDVNWKATAKRGHFITNVFQIERTQEVYVAIDCSRLSNRPSSDSTPGITTLDRFITTALILCMVAQQQGDHFGLITFSDQVHNLIRARNGKSHFTLCRDALYNLEPRLVTPDFEELFSAIRVRLRKRALIVILAPLDDPLLSESFCKSVELVNRQHLVVVSMIEPGRVEPIFKSAVESEAQVYEALAGHLVWQKLRGVEKSLALRGVRCSVLGDEALAPGVISNYLEIKQRQIL